MSSLDATVISKGPIRRKLTDMTAYKEFKEKPIKFNSIPKSRQWIGFNGKYFKCYKDDDVIRMPNEERELLKRKKQDDDKDSDDEVIYSAINYNFNNLVNALNQENNTKKHYSLNFY